MTLDEIVLELADIERRAIQIAEALKPMGKFQDPNDPINLAWNAVGGGVSGAAKAARVHILAARKEVLGG